MQGKIIAVVVLLLSVLSAGPAPADEISHIRLSEQDGRLQAAWHAGGRQWRADARLDAWLPASIPLLQVDVRSGDETLLAMLPNCYYRGSLTGKGGKVIADSFVHLNLCDNAIPFSGYVSVGSDMYLIVADPASSTGIAMRLEQTSDQQNDADDSIAGDAGWGPGGSGGHLDPVRLYSRGQSPQRFPSLDIYVEPAYIDAVGADHYISRIIASLAVANTIYGLSGLRQLQLAAIIRTSENLGFSDSESAVLMGLEKIRHYTVQADSADAAVVFAGDNFSRPFLWGWSEIGFGCALQMAVARGDDVNSRRVGRAAAALIDLPSLLQRGWLLAHEVAHIFGAVHVMDDPLASGWFMPELALKDYQAGCQAISRIYASCAFDARTGFLTDFYQCD